MASVDDDDDWFADARPSRGPQAPRAPAAAAAAPGEKRSVKPKPQPEKKAKPGKRHNGTLLPSTNENADVNQWEEVELKFPRDAPPSLTKTACNAYESTKLRKAGDYTRIRINVQGTKGEQLLLVSLPQDTRVFVNPTKATRNTRLQFSSRYGGLQVGAWPKNPFAKPMGYLAEMQRAPSAAPSTAKALCASSSATTSIVAAPALPSTSNDSGASSSTTTFLVAAQPMSSSMLTIPFRSFSTMLDCSLRLSSHDPSHVRSLLDTVDRLPLPDGVAALGPALLINGFLSRYQRSTMQEIRVGITMAKYLSTPNQTLYTELCCCNHGYDINLLHVVDGSADDAALPVGARATVQAVSGVTGVADLYVSHNVHGLVRTMFGVCPSTNLLHVNVGTDSLFDPLFAVGQEVLITMDFAEQSPSIAVHPIVDVSVYLTYELKTVDLAKLEVHPEYDGNTSWTMFPKIQFSSREAGNRPADKVLLLVRNKGWVFEAEYKSLPLSAGGEYCRPKVSIDEQVLKQLLAEKSEETVTEELVMNKLTVSKLTHGGRAGLWRRVPVHVPLA